MKSPVYKRYLALIFLLAVIVLLLPSIIRTFKGNDSPPGTETYLTIKISNLISNEKSIPKEDTLSYGGRIFPYYIGYPTLISSLSSITKIQFIMLCRILNILLGMFSLLIIYLLIRKLTNENKLKLLILIIIVLSPPFIYLFSTCNNYSILVFLSLLAFYLLLNKKLYLILSTLIIILLGLFSFYIPLIFLAVIFLYIIFKDRAKIKWFIITTLLTLFVIIYYNYLLLNLPLFYERLAFSVKEKGINFAFQSIISDFGGKFGISLFTIVLSLFGFKKLWINKYKILHFYLIVILLVIISFYLTESLFYLNIILSIVAAIGLLNLIKARWQSNLIKTLLVLIIICGIIFSGFSYINRVSNELPNREIIRGLLFLKERTNTNDVIFSHYSRGHWINAISERKNFMDDYFAYVPNVNARWEDSQKILYSRNLDDTTKILDKYNIRYIWLDNDLKKSLWESETGLLFVLKNSKNFKNVYNDNYVEIWRYERTS